jgi:D-threonate/D-erythronate kinase
VEVLSVDLDVREHSVAEAAAAVALATALLGQGARVFVKIDSTLRGPVAGLVANEGVVVIAPAFPEQGRVLRGGRVYVNGQPGTSLLDLLGHNQCEVVRAETVSNVEDAVSLGAPYVVVDADGSLPLRAVADAARIHPEWRLVGSSGLARQLAPPHQSASPLCDQHGVVLVVAGSPTSVTRQQLQALAGLAEVEILATPPTDTRDSGQAAAALADAVAAWSQSRTPRAVVLTGGATAREVGHRMGVSGLRVRGELEPGIPFGSLEGGIWHGIPVVTKAGGFGTPRTLLDVVRPLGVSSPDRHHD